MITDQFMIYFVFQMILLMLNLAGKQLYILWYFGIIGTMISAISTIWAFGADYWPFAIFLILVNIITPIIGLSHSGANK